MAFYPSGVNVRLEGTEITILCKEKMAPHAITFIDVAEEPETLITVSLQTARGLRLSILMSWLIRI